MDYETPTIRVLVDGKVEMRRIIIRDGHPSPETRDGEHLSQSIGGGWFITTVRES